MTKRMMKTMDGNTAAAHVAYAFTEVASIFPITPSSPMAEHVDEWAASGRKNLFGHKVDVVEMESEAGAAGAIHGSLQAGALTTTFTSSQGLMLMIPNLFKIAGELLPGVFHVASRTVATNALTIFAEHMDVMATRMTGVAMIAESSVQEVMDLSAVAHASAISGRLPFMNFFDGFRTSHELQKIEVLGDDDLRQMLDMEAVMAFRKRAMNPDKPVFRGAVESPEIYFQHRESANKFYDQLPDIVNGYMDKVSEITGREYHPFNYTGAPDAEYVMVIMGSGAEVAEETVNYLTAKGEKVGVINVHLFRPFSTKFFLETLPATAKRVVVMERTKEIAATGEPMFEDVASVFSTKANSPEIYGGRYGLGSKELLPVDIVSVFDNLKAYKPMQRFTVGIVDDVTHLSLSRKENIHLAPKGLKACKFWGFGSDGTVGANKSAIKIIGDHTDMYAQAYFAYDSKKSGGITISHLRFGDAPIKMPYLIHTADFIACHRQGYVNQYELLQGLRKGGTFLLNCTWKPEELEEKLPAVMKRYIAQNDIEFYTLDAVGIAQKLGLGSRINMIMQSGFFHLAQIIPVADAVKYLKEAVESSYGNKGQDVVDKNNAAIDEGVKSVVRITVPGNWLEAVDAPKEARKVSDFYKNFGDTVNKQLGDILPVSTFEGWEDGTYPTGITADEKRGVAINVPEWIPENCIQCNQCSFVCPHAAIRPFLSTAEETAAAPAGYETKVATGAKEYQFRIVVSQEDCLGCGSCANICPAPKKALVMKSYDTQTEKSVLWDYALTLAPKVNPMNKYTVKGSQFETPLLEFSGACAGCAETTYAKVVTQLYGDRMMIANAHGCSSVWGGSAPSCSYTKNANGHGPAWADSLFEDNAEFGFGMFLGTRNGRKVLAGFVDEALVAGVGSAELQVALQEWKENMMISDQTRERADKVEALLTAEAAGIPILETILDYKQYLVKRSQWIFGGDGWSYDIGFGGLDHVLAQGEDVNVLIFDTEVYSNTGGQSSKATPTAAIAKFAAAGKKTKKKDLGMIAMTYGYIYVAQIAMGADKNQMMKAMAEAEAYPGPSVIIAYSPCINHGLRIGMGFSQEEEKRAVAAGYWDLYRYNPSLKDEGKNPFSLDSKAPTANFREFLMGEVRFSSLLKSFPDTAEALFEKTEADANERRMSYVRMQKSLEVEK